MSIAKLQPPRKLTDEEDLDSFEDWWFQVISYFSKDPNFKEILDNPTYSWQEPQFSLGAAPPPRRAWWYC